MAGDVETGVMVMKMEEGLDTGPIAKEERVPIPFDVTAGDLHDRLARLGADLMVGALDALERGMLPLTPQPQAGVTYAHKIAKEETRVAWERPWQEVHNHIRGLSPAPGAWFEIAAEGVRVKALRTTSQHIVVSDYRYARKTVVAIKANDELHRPEVEQLLQDLMACELPYCCPHGRPTMIQIGYGELERKFGRKV